MKIRFLTSIASQKWAFHAGDTLEITKVTPEVSAWLKPQQGRPAIAELLREVDQEIAIEPELSETAVTATVKRRRTRETSE